MSMYEGEVGWVERQSGPPRRKVVDGPGCTPAVVPCAHAESCCKGPGVCTHDCTPAVIEDQEDGDLDQLVGLEKLEQDPDPDGIYADSWNPEPGTTQ